ARGLGSIDDDRVVLGEAVGKRLGRVDESKLTEALGQRSKGRGTCVREAAGQDEDAHRGNGITSFTLRPPAPPRADCRTPGDGPRSRTRAGLPRTTPGSSSPRAS